MHDHISADSYFDSDAISEPIQKTLSFISSDQKTIGWDEVKQ
jgi:hypothetical protein